VCRLCKIDSPSGLKELLGLVPRDYEHHTTQPTCRFRQRMHDCEYRVVAIKSGETTFQGTLSFRSCRLDCYWALHCNSPSRAACIWHDECLIGMDNAINLETSHASLQATRLPNTNNGVLLHRSRWLLLTRLWPAMAPAEIRPPGFAVFIIIIVIGTLSTNARRLRLKLQPTACGRLNSRDFRRYISIT
jgi:hypothetical protein